MTLRAKARRYQRMKTETARLERELRAEAEPIFKAEGCLMLPRIERIIERFAA